MLFYSMFKLNRFQYTRSPSYAPVPVQHVQHVQPVRAQTRNVPRSRSVAHQIISMRGIMVHQAKSCGACGRK